MPLFNVWGDDDVAWPKDSTPEPTAQFEAKDLEEAAVMATESCEFDRWTCKDYVDEIAFIVNEVGTEQFHMVVLKPATTWMVRNVDYDQLKWLRGQE